MSQRDVLAELRTAYVEAPPELRRRVRLIAAQAPPERPRRSWRLALVLVPVAAAAALAVLVVATRTERHPGTTVADHGAAVTLQKQAGSVRGAAPPAPAPSAGRAQRYDATLRLSVPTAKDVSAGVAQALHVAALLGGFPASVHVSTTGQAGSADLVLRVPRAHVQAAVARLSKLGTVVGEQVDIQDVQAGLNALAARIARLQRELKGLRAQPQTPAVVARIAALTNRIESLQRSRIGTVGVAHFATVRLALATPAPHARHHRRFGEAVPWLGGAAIAALVLLAVALVRRWREDALLSRP